MMPKLFSEDTRYRLAMITKFASPWMPVLALLISFAADAGVTIREVASACAVALPASWAIWAAYIAEPPIDRKDRLERESQDIEKIGEGHG